MMDVDRMLFELRVYSGDSYGYFLVRDAINLLIARGEDWAPTLKALQEEVQKHQHCSYDSFQKHIEKVSHLAWERNPKLLNTYAHRDLEKAPTANEFIEILYTYILRNEL